MDDSLRFYVISTSAGFFAQNGFVEHMEDAVAYTCEDRANNAALTMDGTVVSQNVSFEELEKEQAQFAENFTSLYSVEEQAAIQDVCSQLQLI